MTIKGIRYLVDESRERTGVVLDLRRHRRLWEDILDRLTLEARRSEPRVSLEQVRRRLDRRHAKRGA